MSSLRPYSNYAESGVGWLGAIPAGWQVRALRYLATVETGSKDTVDAEAEGEYPFIVRSQTPLRINSYSYDTEAILTAGDGDVGEVFHHLRGKFDVHQRVYVLRNFRGVHGRFLYYFFSSEFRNVVAYGGVQTTVSSLRRPMFSSFPVVVPDQSTQRVIARFLDLETAEIDEFISEQNRLIKLLEERRRSVLLISTIGSPASISGPLGRFLSKQSRPPRSSVTVTAFRDGEVTSRANRREEGFTLSEADFGYQGVEVGDLVFHGLDGFAGAVGVCDSAGQCSPVYHVCSGLQDVEIEYMAQYLRALGASGFLEAYAWSVRQRSVDYRNWAVFSKLPVSLPGIDVQRAQVQFMNDSFAEIDAAIADARQAIALSRERRAALISAAVTGKIDVGDH